VRKNENYRGKEVFTREDFIVRLPSDLFEKEGQKIIYNTSTKDLNSEEHVRER
jgi:hypothetical protein